MHGTGSEAVSLPWRREFGDVLDAVRGPKAKVVAVTSAERANAVNDKERPGFFDQITKVCTATAAGAFLQVHGTGSTSVALQLSC